jgi:hypothetical protein
MVSQFEILCAATKRLAPAEPNVYRCGTSPKDGNSRSEPPAVAGGHVRQAHPLPQVVLTWSWENSLEPPDNKRDWRVGTNQTDTVSSTRDCTVAWKLVGFSGRATSTGQGAWRSTRSTFEPKSARIPKPAPCAPMLIKSISFFSA